MSQMDRFVLIYRIQEKKNLISEIYKAKMYGLLLERQHVVKLRKIWQFTSWGPQQYTDQVWSLSDERFSKYAKDSHT